MTEIMTDTGITQLAKPKRNDLLKIIAMLTMFIDHVGILLYPDISILRTIGRIAFPIFAYGIAVGYRYTSNRIRYASRLIFFGLLSQIPYMYLNYDFTKNPNHCNIMLFFAYSFLMLYAYDQIGKSYKKKNYPLTALWTIAMIVVIVLPDVFVYYNDTYAFSYGSYGLLMILIFYGFKEKVIPIIIVYLLLSMTHAYYRGVLYLSRYSLILFGESLTFIQSIIRFDVVWDNITTYKDGLRNLEGYFFQARSLMGLGFILTLRTFKLNLKLNRYVAYIFYPAHIILIILIRILFEGPF
jgi:hypothetical protein